MSKRLMFWILFLLWIVLGFAWHFAVFGLAIWGIMIIPVLLVFLLGWQVFGSPID